MNGLALLIAKLRGYLRDVQQSRQDLAYSISQEHVLAPIPGDHKPSN
jgi:hypothetical protein